VLKKSNRGLFERQDDTVKVTSSSDAHVAFQQLTVWQLVARKSDGAETIWKFEVGGVHIPMVARQRPKCCLGSTAWRLCTPILPH
jgi:hypothetical protein